MSRTAVAGSPRKAAIALVALGPERAAAVLRGLSETEAKALAAQIAALGPVDSDEVRGAVTDLARAVTSGTAGRLPAPGKGFAKDLLLRALGEERGRAAGAELDVAPPFAWLAEGDPATVAEVLAGEPAAAVALALAHLEPRAAADLLVRLPEQVRLRVATRIGALGAVHPDTLAQVENGLRVRVAEVLTSDVKKLAGPALLAELLSKAGRDATRELLAAVAAHDPELAEATRNALFTFEDLCALDARTMQVLLRSVDTKELAVALSSSPENVRDKVLGNLSERAREALVEEIELLRGIKSKQVEEARTAIITTARRLEEEGALVLVRPGEEE